MLGPGIDIFDELEDVKITTSNIPFIASESFLSQHGTKFILLFEEGKLQVRPINNNN